MPPKYNFEYSFLHNFREWVWPPTRNGMPLTVFRVGLKAAVVVTRTRPGRPIDCSCSENGCDQSLGIHWFWRKTSLFFLLPGSGRPARDEDHPEECAVLLELQTIGPASPAPRPVASTIAP